MIVPGILISLVTLWADKRFQRIYRFTCNSFRYYGCSNSKRPCHFGCRLYLSVLKAVFSGLVWVISLLLDGDWLACCYNSIPKNETLIPCKENDQLNLTEKMSLREQKNTSMLYGFYLICAMLLVIIGTTCLSCCKCCYSSYCGLNQYINEFEDNLLEEVETISAENLKTISKGYITEKFKRNPKLNILIHDPDEETSGDAFPTSTDAPGTSGDAPGTTKTLEKLTHLSQNQTPKPNGANQKTDFVEKVKKIDWDEFYKFSYDLIYDFQADMKRELYKKKRKKKKKKKDSGSEDQQDNQVAGPDGSPTERTLLMGKHSSKTTQGIQLKTMSN